MKRTILCILGLASLSGAQGVPGGTINGKAIPSALFTSPRVCEALRSTIRSAARDQVFREMGATVTPEDIAEAKKAIKTPDPKEESRFFIENEQRMVDALTAVDKGQSPDQVYKDMLQPKGVLPEVWASYQRQWKDPQGHKTILTRLTWTPEVLAKANANFNYEPFARNQKLDRLVDQELAAKDPAFRTALDHFGGGRGLPASEKQYLETQREAYWKAQARKLTVTLNDPKLAQKCGLATK